MENNTVISYNPPALTKAISAAYGLEGNANKRWKDASMFIKGVFENQLDNSNMWILTCVPTNNNESLAEKARNMLNAKFGTNSEVIKALRTIKPQIKKIIDAEFKKMTEANPDYNYSNPSQVWTRIRDYIAEAAGYGDFFPTIRNKKVKKENSSGDPVLTSRTNVTALRNKYIEAGWKQETVEAFENFLSKYDKNEITSKK
tara:strand:+ start:255 stop:857 length:603 start_codon:yes stop_codon:yes gene_type:complete